MNKEVAEKIKAFVIKNRGKKFINIDGDAGYIIGYSSMVELDNNEFYYPDPDVCVYVCVSATNTSSKEYIRGAVHYFITPEQHKILAANDAIDVFSIDGKLVE